MGKAMRGLKSRVRSGRSKTMQLVFTITCCIFLYRAQVHRQQASFKIPSIGGDHDDVRDISNLRSTVSIMGTPLYEDDDYQIELRKSILIRFENVHLSNTSAMTVYYKPGMPVPTADQPMNLYNWTEEDPLLPTRFEYALKFPQPALKIQYVADKGQLSDVCKTWFDTPTLLFDVTYPTSFFHAWREGILGTFQTLRDLNLVQLISIDDDGVIKELVDGKADFCHRYDFAQQRFQQQDTCWKYSDLSSIESTNQNAYGQRAGLPIPKKCIPGKVPWCQPGVYSYQTLVNNSPIVVPFKDEAVPSSAAYKHEDAYIYRGITSQFMDGGVPSLPEQGACFRDLILGVSPVFFDRLYKVPGKRRARQDMIQFISSLKHPTSSSGLEGYKELGMDMLRRGVTYHDIGLVYNARLNDAELLSLPKGALEDYKRLKREWIEKAPKFYSSLENSSSRNVEDIPLQRQWKASDPPQAIPTVTVILRRTGKTLSRSMLNPEDIFEYMLRWYNVTLVATTFSEPLEDAIELMRKTDVLIGMHGGSWTNAYFLKNNASCLQMSMYGLRYPNKTYVSDAYVDRIGIYYNVTVNSGCHYVPWYNENPSLAFFPQANSAKLDITSDPPMLHPTKSTPRHPTNREQLDSRWMGQNTYVDMESIAPNIDAAMAAAGIPRYISYIRGDLALAGGDVFRLFLDVA